MNKRELQTKVNEAIINGNQSVIDLVSHQLATKVMKGDVNCLFLSSLLCTSRIAPVPYEYEFADIKLSIPKRDWKPFTDANHTRLLVTKALEAGKDVWKWLGLLFPYSTDKTHDARQVMNAYWDVVTKDIKEQLEELV